MVKTYAAVRILTKGNLFFPDHLIVDTTKRKLTFKKRNFYGFGHDIIIINFSDVISFRVTSRVDLLMFCNVEIETRGGRLVNANGFLKKDVNEIKSFIGF